MQHWTSSESLHISFQSALPMIRLSFGMLSKPQRLDDLIGKGSVTQISLSSSHTHTCLLIVSRALEIIFNTTISVAEDQSSTPLFLLFKLLSDIEVKQKFICSTLLVECAAFSSYLDKLPAFKSQQIRDKLPEWPQKQWEPVSVKSNFIGTEN